MAASVIVVIDKAHSNCFNPVLCAARDLLLLDKSDIDASWRPYLSHARPESSFLHPLPLALFPTLEEYTAFKSFGLGLLCQISETKRSSIVFSTLLGLVKGFP
jgi:hypothetical protein